MTIMVDEASLRRRADAAMSGAGDARRHIVGLLRDFSIETTPGAAAKVADFRAHLRPGGTVYVTFLPGSDFADTVAVAERLAAEGFRPVPHIAARSLPDAATLENGLRRLRAAVGLDQALVIAGSVTTPRGPFADSLQLLETGLFEKYGIGRLGIAGHPEGSPDIPDAAIEKALAAKAAYAARTGAELTIVTQFVFEAAPVIAWERRLRAAGNALPIHVGVPGLATLRTLLAHAKACGIGPSLRFLTRQARSAGKLLTVSVPDRLLTALAAARATDPGCRITGVHMYPLGGLRRTAAWANAVAEGRLRMNRDGTGFSVDTDLA